MAEASQQHLSLPSGLVELCALLGAPRDSLRSLEQFSQKRGVRSLSSLDPEVLSVFVPPFISKEDSQWASGNYATLGKGRRRSFRKKREKPKTEPWKGPPVDSKRHDSEDISIPGGVDLLALPQLCFPGGMHVASEPKEDHVHFLVLTDVCGNRTYGVVAQYYRPLHDDCCFYNGTAHWEPSWPSIVGVAGCFVPFAVCVISRFPYYNSLKDCLSCLLTHLKLCKDFEVDNHIKDFAARLSLIPSPPPGPLHLMFNMKPLHVVFPSRADPESPVIDLDLHLPLLCFQPEKVLQILSCLLTEQRIVFFSSDWALLTLIAECFMVYLHPLQWQHTFVPILSGKMLDFVMAPTSFLMGCHLDHFEEVSKEADGLILIDIDHGSITCSKYSDNDMNIPDIPLLVAQMFIQREQDICYYNFLCAHPLGNLSTFNNILSNLGYILLGLLFLLIILQQEINHNWALLCNDLHAMECGIPKHFGLFYAMGTALMIEGLLSACYHVCPNYTNFQFDTSFMYMIAGLCMLKLYQKCHPDINASAYSAYACLSIVIFFSVLGMVFGKGNTSFWIVFSVIHIIASLLLSTQLYYMGHWKLDWGIFCCILHVLYMDYIRQCSGPLYVDCMVLLVMGNIINWSLAAYGLITRPSDFASYLLAIGICSLLLYFAFCIIMKLRSGDTCQKTPAESREHNRDCILLDFFDDHDIWHFLSSIATFVSFLVLLTLDNDLDTVQQDKIYVF
ncbi:DENN domain-containing protein 3 [Fukomys damarensis]|uniref:DENN domain-containing protein 3 n=1 Tax=Fukomys damarensis TaxID=885580 RepID=A0A091D975_FUKDA|nr:DENN domain-containing protein 3 [Fukomys damarensis]